MKRRILSTEIVPNICRLLTNSPALRRQKNHAAAIFPGAVYSLTALGDYARPSHALPTMGTARFFGGCALSDFMKKNHVISYSKKALEEIRGPIERVAKLEGLPKHYESVNARFLG